MILEEPSDIGRLFCLLSSLSERILSFGEKVGLSFI